MIIRSELVKPEQEVGFLFTVLKDLSSSKPKVVPMHESNNLASLSLLFDAKESQLPPNQSDNEEAEE